jgi:hypothetical protein
MTKLTEPYEMLTGGKWGEHICSNCGVSLGALITCRHCGYINSYVDHVNISPERVEETAESVHDESTELVEAAEKPTVLHRYVGSFGD